MQVRDVLLRTRRVLSMYKVYGDSAPLVLNRTSLNSVVQCERPSGPNPIKFVYINWGCSCTMSTCRHKYAEIPLFQGNE